MLGFYSGVSVQMGIYDESGIRLPNDSDSRAALQASVRKSSTLRPCWRRLVTAVSILPTNQLPYLLCVPKDFLLHNTARLNARSALLLVGSAPSTLTNVQSDCSSFNMATSQPSLIRRLVLQTPENHAPDVPSRPDAVVPPPSCKLHADHR